MELDVSALEMFPVDEPTGLLECVVTCHTHSCIITSTEIIS
jgi:hypothetical protein